MAELGQIETARTPASQVATPPPIPKTTQAYPMVEEMTFRGIIQSEEQGLKLLRAIQILVNELGAGTIIQVMDSIEKKPVLMQKAKSYLPYITML